MIKKMDKGCSEKLRKMLNTEWTVVLLRDGRLGVVMEEEKRGDLCIFGRDKNYTILSLNGIVRVRQYDENLHLVDDDDYAFNRNYDIMAMLHVNHLDSFEFKKILFGLKDPSDIHWDWRREEVKEVTMADIEEVFGCKVKIVKEKENE